MTLILKMKKFSYTIRKEENGDNLNDNEYEYEKDFVSYENNDDDDIMVVTNEDNSKCSSGTLCLIIRLQ